MAKDYAYSIDNVTYKINDIDKYIVVTGWCFKKNEKLLEYKVYIDDNEVELGDDLARIERKDVRKAYSAKKFANNEIELESGFDFCVYLDGPIHSIKVDVITSKETITILKMNESQLNRKLDHSVVEYAVDRCITEKVGNESVVKVKGWSFSPTGNDITYKVYNSAGKEMNIQLKTHERFDLYNFGLVDKADNNCGFTIEFDGDLKKEKYYIEFSDNKYIEKEKLEKTQEKGQSFISFYVHAFSLRRIQKGMKYWQEHGFTGFITKLKTLRAQTEDYHYHYWFMAHKVTDEELERQRKIKFSYSPKISIIVPTFNTDLGFLKEMIDSVVYQSYSNWELCLADGSTNDKVYDYVKELQKTEDRVKINRLKENYGISGNTNEALKMTTGEYVALFDHDDVLTLDALYEIVNQMQETHYDVVYTDEDKLDNGTKKYMDPNLKPDFNIDLLTSHNYITHFFVVKSEIINGIGGFRSEYDGSQDYDLIFRCVENAKTIYHIPKVVYHWRMHSASTAANPESKMYCYDAGKRAIEAHYKRIGVEAKVVMLTPLYGMYHSIYSTKDNPLVSIIIPNKDHKDILKTCVDSLYEVNEYKNFELIIVENNSETKEIFDYYDELKKKHDNVKVVNYKGEFNFSAINNFGVQSAEGNYILFLNNDTQMIKKDSLKEMVGCILREDVGVVGAKLLYADDTIQHAGVIIGYGHFAGHAFAGLDNDDYGFMLRTRVNCDYSAVTGACLMVKKDLFEKVGGFSTDFKISCNDIDLCFKIRELGKVILFDTFSLWHHFESKSRGYDEKSKEKMERFEKEAAMFKKKWPEIYEKGDPYYNPNFSLEKMFTLKEDKPLPEEE